MNSVFVINRVKMNRALMNNSETKRRPRVPQLSCERFGRRVGSPQGLLSLVAAALTFFSAAPASERAEAREDLSGTYVLFQQAATLTPLPVIKDVVAKTQSVALLHLRQDGARLTGSGRLCDLRIESSSKMVRTEIPAPLFELVEEVPFDASLKTQGREQILSQRASTLVLGANLKGHKEALPKDPEDPRVVDQDEDGHPGVTVRISGFVSGEVYVAQRNTSRIFGRGNAGAFEGKVSVSTEQSVLGASNRFLKTSLDSRPLPAESFFIMKKSGSNLSCGEATEQARSWLTSP